MSVRRMAFYGLSGSNERGFSLLEAFSQASIGTRNRDHWPTLIEQDYINTTSPQELENYAQMTNPIRTELYLRYYSLALDADLDLIEGIERQDADRLLGYYDTLFNATVGDSIPYKTLFIDINLPWVRDTKTTNNYLKTVDAHSGIVEITPVYNFYAGEYQDNISSPLIDERVLPSIYENEIARILDERDNDSYLGSPLTLSASRSGRGDLIPQSQQDWEEYGQFVVENLVDRDTPPSLIIFPQTEVKEILDLHKKKNLYPMYVDITFQTAPMGSLMKAVEKARLSTTFFNEVARQINSGIKSSFSVAGIASTVTEVTQEGETSAQIDKHYINAYQPRNLESGFSVDVYDIDSALRTMINNAREGNIEGASNTEFLTLRGSERNPNAPTGGCLSLLDRVYLKAVTDRMDGIIANSSAPSLLDRAIQTRQLSQYSIADTNSYQDLADDFGQEVIGYAIQKSTELMGVVSTHIFPNTDALDELKFVDTQVKYDKQYYYEVFALVLTTSETGFLDASETTRNNDNRRESYRFITHAEKKLVLAMVPVASDTLLDDINGSSFPTIRIIDGPPIPPNFTFIPYKGVKNKMLIKLERQTDELTGQRTVPYIPILSGDAALFSSSAEQQRLENFDLPDGHVEFKAEGEDTVAVQVFRTTEPPKHNINPEDGTIVNEKLSAYESFSDNLYRLVTADEGLAFTDTLSPNIKYYYTFRSVDINDNISNPTAIMQVEIVETEGVTYPLVKEYVPVRAEPDKTDSRNMARFLQIRPSYFMSEPLPDENNQLVIRGRDGNTTFGKHYKIRITSLDTGRQLDVNCTFVGEGLED